MSIVVPNVGEAKALELLLAGNLSLRLYSNNLTPGEETTLGSLVEVVGGGYVGYILTPEDWIITNGIATQEFKDFIFTDTTSAPGTVYGFYVVDADGVLRWLERFSESVLPFTPTNGSIIRVKPRFQVG